MSGGEAGQPPLFNGARKFRATKADRRDGGEYLPSRKKARGAH